MGAGGHKHPVLFIVDPKDENASYMMEDASGVDAKSIDRFINNFNKKRLTKYVKSLPIPEKVLGESVVTIVGKNYNEIVKESS